MAKLNLRNVMLAKLHDEKVELRQSIAKLNQVLQEHIVVENRVRHLPKEKFNEILEKDQELLKELTEIQTKMEEADVEQSKPEERSTTPDSDNEQLSDGP
jgi:hypothetical protein